MSTSPYENLPSSAFWRPAVAEQSPWETGIYRKRFEITRETKVATAGSCFAQHIATWMRRDGFNVLDVEPSPQFLRGKPLLSFGYGLYSARYGNIYTVRQLLQLAQESLGRFDPGDIVWAKGDQYIDALRPNVEPEGLPSPEIVRQHRADHLRQVALLLAKTDLFVFTFGLTEAWVHRELGTVYPTAPGTIAGTFSDDTFVFKNFTFSEIKADFVAFRELLKTLNANVKFLVTVSPVPLTATASGKHVLAATVYSKSVLRAVVGELYDEFDDVDYFPSYELIGTPFTRRSFYHDNLREVRKEGVETAMRNFWRSMEEQFSRPRRKKLLRPSICPASGQVGRRPRTSSAKKSCLMRSHADAALHYRQFSRRHNQARLGAWRGALRFQTDILRVPRPL